MIINCNKNGDLIETNGDKPISKAVFDQPDVVTDGIDNVTAQAIKNDLAKNYSLIDL